jgi:hypothetical protein
MEGASNGKVEVGGSDTAKKKRSWGSAFYTFLASGGIMLLVLAGGVLLVVISILLK